jgi:hypothetical protein
MYVASTELLLFAPLIWFAVRPRLRRSIAIPVWLVALWLLLSGDPVRERLFRAVLRDDTLFAQGFSDNKLNSVARGQTFDDVRARIGPPLGEYLGYDRIDTCLEVFLEGDTVSHAWPVEQCRARGVRPGSPRSVIAYLGVPSEHCWLYSRSPDNGYFRARIVCFEDGRVVRVIRRWMRG